MELVRRGLLLAGALLVLGASGVAEAAPAALSGERSPADVRSTFGSGVFGRWSVDRFGLAGFRYLVDQQTFPPARQPELKGATEAQHQLGNDHITAAAFNHGYTQLWSQARLPQWANRWDPATGHYGGGFGYLNVGGRVLSTLYLDRPRGARTTRTFGTGYYEHTLRAAGLDVLEKVYAPYGDDPLLLHDVTIRNRTRAPRRVSWFEYWDVNPWIEAVDSGRAVGTPTWSPGLRTLAVPQAAGDLGDQRPLSIFAAALSGPVGGHETSTARFFGTGTRQAPAAVRADRLSRSTAAAGGRLFAIRAPLRLRPGQSVTLRYAYGMAHPERVAPLVRKYRRAGDPFTRSERRWAAWLPRADFGAGKEWVARELQWDAYLLRSASVYEEECGHHTITQGGYYQYSSGANLGSRSWLHYMLPMVYAEPWLAREILRFTVGVQSKARGDLPYGLIWLCRHFNALGTSSDLDFWLLLAAAEYGLGTRDVRFFRERHPFTDSPERVSVWEHVKIAFRHQESLRGPHGGYLAGTNGDWSDFSAELLKMSETTLVAAQLAFAYPRLADLADLRGDRAFAAQLRRRAAELREVVAREWTGRGWYSRGYNGSLQIGTGAIFGEPQPWAVLAGVPGPRRARTLVANIRRFLTGVGAPAGLGGPARIGSAMSPAERDPLVTEAPTSPELKSDGASQWPGGVWFDINGWLTWALAELDGVVPGAARYAWDEYTRNTLAAHANAYPRHWDGTISIDDACNAHYAQSPSRCGIVLFDDYQGQITEQPTWMVMNAVNLAGVRATRSGFEIDPHLRGRFSLRMARVGVARGVERAARLPARGAPRATEAARARARPGRWRDRVGRWAALSLGGARDAS